MLTRLEIRDFALIDHAVIQPGAGLNVITGETGAGKSILIDALGAVAGNRTARDLVRSGKDRAIVEAAFLIQPGAIAPESLASLGIEGGEVVLSREIAAGGKSTARLNGRLVPVGMLREIGSQLLDIHGQFDNQIIFHTDSHLSLLDRFGGEGLQAELDRYSTAYRAYMDCVQAIRKHGGGDPAERERHLDMLRYQLDEIRTVDPKDGEDEVLSRRRKVAANAVRIIASLQNAYTLLSGDEEIQADSLLSMADGALGDAAAGMDEAKTIQASVRDARFLVEEATESIRSLLDTVDDDPEELEKMDTRLDELFRIKRKYGKTLSDVLAFAVQLEKQLDDAENGRARLEEWQKQKEVLRRRVDESAERLHVLRFGCADELADRICQELAAVDMVHVRFHVSLERLSDREEPGKRGADAVEFQISPNPGEPLRPLARIASGGEASRIMLAIKTILAAADHTPVLVFDEIDTGVSGQTAARVGERLSIIGESHQVFCVTHLAQIASLADHHLLIRKTTDGRTTTTRLDMLEDREKEEELARLLSGGSGRDDALRLASRMREDADSFRRSRNLPGNG